ncbi:MAG: DUF1287 domain-containing protein [Rhodothermales bacterium]
MNSRIAAIAGTLMLLAGMPPVLAQDSTTVQIVEAAIEQVGQTIYYDPAYRRLAYPGGDVPSDRGVCTDVVVRAFRAVGVDLQVLVHEDMKAAFWAYPQLWGLSRPDANIDHRRVPNLMTFFERAGKALPLSDDPSHYVPGDVVAWRLPGGRLHTGIVANVHAPGTSRFLLVHNIGAGARMEDILFAYEIIGHYRYF